MKTFAFLASVVSVAAASPRPAEYHNALAESTDCIPENFTVTNFEASGENTTSLDTASFSYYDPHTRLNTTCELNSTSEDLSAEGSQYSKYACDSDLLKFTWGLNSKGKYLISVAETICNGSEVTSDSWIPDFTCQNGTESVECKFAEEPYTANFSGAPQPVQNQPSHSPS